MNLCSSQDFQGNVRHFLRKSIMYKFIDKVELKESNCYLKVINMVKCDSDALNKYFTELHPNMRISDTRIYSNSTRFYDENDSKIDYLENREWYITIIIQGYKQSVKGSISPIWQILLAKLAK